MHKFLRFYRQNRMMVWLIALGIMFIILVIQVLNSIERENIERQNNNNTNEETTLNNVVSYNTSSESIISEEDVPEQYREDFGNLIEQFFTYCINHETKKAYNLLSENTIDNLYPNETIFENLYCTEKFEGNKEFSYQSWIKYGNLYIYQVKIFDNMLATGISNDTYYEDYVTIVPENGEYKLNINELVGIKEIYQQYNSDELTIKVKESQVFMDYEIYSFEIKNNSEIAVMLDSREDTDSTYIIDSLNNRYSALLYENNEEELILQPGETKTISIKFSDVYREGIVITQIHFSDIILDYNTYAEGNEVERSTFQIEL